MIDTDYSPVKHDHKAFLNRAAKRPGFKDAYNALEGEYAIVRQLLAARMKAGLTQEAVASQMGVSKSAVLRLESAGKKTASLATLKKYACVVGCKVELKLVPLK